MPEYLAPGVYVEEVSSGIRPIEGVSTSTAGFLGRTERGPEGANYVTSFAEFQRWYGGLGDIDQRMWLPNAVKGFFDNGGRRAFVSRVVGTDDTLAQGSLGPLQVTSIGRGVWGNTLRVLLSQGTGRKPNQFRVSVIWYRNALPDRPGNPLVDPRVLLGLPVDDRPSRRPLDAFEDFDNPPRWDHRPARERRCRVGRGRARMRPRHP